MKRSKFVPVKIVLALSSAALALLLLEAAFRLAGIKGGYSVARRDVVIPRPGGPYLRLPNAFVPHATIRSIYPDNPRGYFGAKNEIDHVFNSAGWRDVEHEIAKPEGTYRILGLGDSYLYGQGVKPEDVVLARLGRLLNAETINTGVSNFNTANERDLLIHRGLAYDPDLVIVHFVLNDVEDPAVFGKSRRQIDFYRNYLSVYTEPDALSPYSHLWGWARQRYLESIRAREYVRASVGTYLENEPKWIHCRDALADIHRITREEGIDLLVVIFPFFHELDGDYPFQPIHDQVREYGRSAGIPVLDLFDHFRNYRGPELWVHRVDQHPNEVAHEIAARAVHDYLVRSGSQLRDLTVRSKLQAEPGG